MAAAAPAQGAREHPGREQLVPLAEAGSEELLALSVAAHWNQTAADWALMLERGCGWGLRDEQGTLVASTLVLPYAQPEVHLPKAGAPTAAGAPFAWISMVLVLPTMRGRGLATRLLRVALDHLQAEGLAAVLDATPAGRPVYSKLGFAEGPVFTRWRRVEKVGAAPQRLDPGIRRSDAADAAAIEALDLQAFGADRSAILKALARRLPQAAWVLAAGAAGGGAAARDAGFGAVQGYLFGRDGRTAAQLGPLVAADAAAAIGLLEAAVAAVSGPLVLDLMEGWEPVQAWLRQNGFAAERPFTRMTRGLPAPPGDRRRVVLVAGPELG